jgi:glycosyltransferase involved in cell wall biosynthesis
MAMGCLVVCSNAGAFPLFVKNGETGFIVELFPEGQSDYDAPMQLEAWQTRRIADTLLAIQAMPAAELKRISDQARAYVRDYFDWSVIARQTAERAYR